MKITKSNLSYTNYFKLLENLTKSRREEKKKLYMGRRILVITIIIGPLQDVVHICCFGQF